MSTKYYFYILRQHQILYGLASHHFNSDLKLELFDIKGNKIQEWHYESANTLFNVKRFTLSTIASGTYILNATAKNYSAHSKLIISK